MADTTPSTFDNLTKEIEELRAHGAAQQKALVRIYRIFDEDMHACTMKLNIHQRMAWMQEIARIASIKFIEIKQASDDTMESAKIEVLQTKKPAKVVGVGIAGEDSGF